jgi:hypothetical protein
VLSLFKIIGNTEPQISVVLNARVQSVLATHGTVIWQFVEPSNQQLTPKRRRDSIQKPSTNGQRDYGGPRARAQQVVSEYRPLHVHGPIRTPNEGVSPSWPKHWCRGIRHVWLISTRAHWIMLKVLEA